MEHRFLKKKREKMSMGILLGTGLAKAGKAATKAIRGNNMANLAGNVLEAGAAAGMGMGMSKWNDKRQFEQQGKLLEQQAQHQQELSKFNQGLAIDTWEKTGAEAQRKQLEKAGLNVGLMYQGGGPGGTTSQPGQLTGGQATGQSDFTGMGIGLQMLEAQKANIEANTEKTKTETEKISGVDTDLAKANKLKLEADTANTQVNNAILQFQKDVEEIKSKAFKDFEQDYRGSLTNLYNKIYGEAQSAMARGELDQATWQTKQKQIENELISSGLYIEAQRKGLIKTGAEIKQIEEQIKNLTADLQLKYQDKFINWWEITLEERETIVKEIMAENASKMTEFNTSTPQEIKQWVGIFGDAIGAIMSVKPKGK